MEKQEFRIRLHNLSAAGLIKDLLTANGTGLWQCDTVDSRLVIDMNNLDAEVLQEEIYNWLKERKEYLNDRRS